MKLNRRNILKGIGISATSSSIVSTAAASGTRDEEGGLEITEMSEYETYQNLSNVLDLDPFVEMREFLLEERQSRLRLWDTDGYRATVPDDEDRIKVIKVPIDNFESDDGMLTVTIFPDNELMITANLSDETYRSGSIISESGSDDRTTSSTESDAHTAAGDHDVMTLEQWTEKATEQVDADPVSAMGGPDCAQKAVLEWDSSVPGWVCEVVFILGSVTVIVFPEPSSSAAGIAAITITATSGGCTAAYKIQNNTDTDLSRYTICLTYDCGGWGSLPTPYCTPVLRAYAGEW